MRAFFAVVAMALVVAACGGGDDVAGGDTGGDVADGEPQLGAWELVSGTVDDEAVPLVDGYRITLTVDEAMLTGSAACNGYGADYTRTGGGGIAISGLAWTEMGCEPAVMASEQAYLAGFQRVDAMNIDDDGMLGLTGPGVELRFTRLEPPPTQSLVDVTWHLDTIVEAGTATSAIGDATLLLSADGSVVGDTGCRALEGTYVVSGDEILFTDLSADGECPADMARQDNQVVTVLGDGFTTTIEGDVLTLTSSGNEQLVYSADG